MNLISPLDIVGNMSADKNSVIGPFVSIANGENIASIASSANIANIANSVLDPFGNIGDRTANPLGNLSAVDPFLVQPDLPSWVGLNCIFSPWRFMMTMTGNRCIYKVLENKLEVRTRLNLS